VNELMLNCGVTITLCVLLCVKTLLVTFESLCDKNKCTPIQFGSGWAIAEMKLKVKEVADFSLTSQYVSSASKTGTFRGLRYSLNFILRGG